ncbi:uncharacterized protein LOC124274278 [Haliotis rubra]|uniref:uncharacterized protein LOC124274278 n=1 Tax=Haliotis rubra TaxID=36100 RepID=UPI001EE51B9F|nr:uncharacterized protein LOC124274278 [Haliotis rubra]
MDIDSSDDDGMFLTQSTYTTQYSDISSDETADKVIVGDVLEGFGDKITQSDDELVASCIVAEKQSTYETTYETDKKGGNASETFADSTVSKMKWATTLFREWQSNRNKLAADTSRNLSFIMVPLEEMSVDELNYTISRFVCEVKKTDGTDFPSDTLYGLVICLQLHMDSIGKAYKFLTDDAFLQIKNTLDNMMKRRAKDPSSKPPVQAEVITPEEEEVLWAKGVLGSDNPKQLLDTIFYLTTPKTDSDPFYLRPLRKPMGDVWYSSQAVGRHSLAAMVSDICQRAGLTGHRTNHSLRATAATRLFEAGVDEQLICEVTGHRSSAVRSYKRTNSAQKRKLSSLLQGQASVPGSASSTACSSTDIDKSDDSKNISVTVSVNVN